MNFPFQEIHLKKKIKQNTKIQAQYYTKHSFKTYRFFTNVPTIRVAELVENILSNTELSGRQVRNLYVF